MTTAKLDHFIGAVLRQLGDPYRFGDEGPDAFDCSGLVFFAAGRANVFVDRVARDQQATLQAVKEPRLGDLVFYGRPAHHVGIYLGDGKMVDAPHTGANVRIDGIGRPTSYGRIAALHA
jgi:cell wall-associated NlpC family hydrolase